MFDYVIAESIRKYFAREWGYCNPCAFSLQYVAKIFEVRVSPPNGTVLQLESRYIRAADDFVVGVHVARCAMSLGILHLGKAAKSVQARMIFACNIENSNEISDFNLQKIFRWPINLLEALLTSIWHCLHFAVYLNQA